MQIFISHSEKDDALYSTLCKVLDGEGIKRGPSEYVFERLACYPTS